MIDCWSELPPELLNIVCNGLDVLQLLYFAAVCRTWFSVAAQNYRKRNQTRKGSMISSSPWLLFNMEFALDSPMVSCASFLSLSDKRRYLIPQSLDMKCPFGDHLVGSAFGWVITATSKTNLFLINPISRCHFPLPPLRKYACLTSKEIFFQKAILSSNPDEGKGYYVYVIARDILHRFHHESTGWTRLSYGKISDAVYHKGEIYVLLDNGDIWSGIDLDVILNCATVDWKYQRNLMNIYLVSSPNSDDLLLVLRYSKMRNHKLYRAVVFRVDLKTKELVELDSLGERSLFVGRYGSFCVSSSCGLSWLKPNCLYISDKETLVMHDMEKQRTKKLALVEDADCMRPSPVWFSPSFESISFPREDDVKKMEEKLSRS